MRRGRFSTRGRFLAKVVVLYCSAKVLISRGFLLQMERSPVLEVESGVAAAADVDGALMSKSVEAAHVERESQEVEDEPPLHQPGTLT